MTDSLTTRAWLALRDLTAHARYDPVTLAQWRTVCPFLNPCRWYDAQHRLAARGCISVDKGRVWIETAPRALVPRPVTAPHVRRALSAAQPAPGRCPVCTRETARWHRHGVLGHTCPACSTAAHMLRDAGTARRLVEVWELLA